MCRRSILASTTRAIFYLDSSLMITERCFSFSCFGSGFDSFRCSSQRWNTECTDFIDSGRFSWYAELWIILLIRYGSRFLWFRDLLRRMIWMNRAFNIIMFSSLSSEAGWRWAFVCFFCLVWAHLSFDRRYSWRFAIFLINLSAFFISRWAVELFSMDIGGSRSKRDI